MYYIVYFGLYLLAKIQRYSFMFNIVQLPTVHALWSTSCTEYTFYKIQIIVGNKISFTVVRLLLILLGFSYISDY